MKRQISALLVMVTATVVLTVQDSISSRNTLYAAASPDGSALCLFCEDPPDFCVGNQHNAYGGEIAGEWARAGGPHYDEPCYSGSCQTKHGPCTLASNGTTTFDEDLDVLRRALDSGDAAAVSMVLGGFAKNRVLLNASRGAVQVLNCNGAIAAHLPISTQLAASLGQDASTGLVSTDRITAEEF
jgi:hypothetical protein